MSSTAPDCRQKEDVAPRRGRSMLRRLLLPGLGFACGVVAAGLLAGPGLIRVGQAGAADGAQDALAARVLRLEAALARPHPAAPADLEGRFVPAALLLQAAIATPRPWLREYQAMVALAPPGALPPPLAEVLLSHAARGLPSEAELRERYAALQPQLIARAPRQGHAADQALSMVRTAAAGIGLAAPPAPTDQEQAIAGVAHQLRRGNLAAAVADAAALDASLQPLLAGWLAQAGARLAVEQAVQETLLRALAAQARPT